MSFRRTSLALSVATSVVALVAISQEAQAGVVGFSSTEISDFAISNSSGVLVEGASVSVFSPLNNESTTATLNGVNATSSVLAIAPSVNQSCLGNCTAFTPASSFNLVTPVLALATTPFSQAATNLSPNAVISVPNPSPPPTLIPAGANANSAAQVQLTGANQGQSNANVGVTAGFSLTLTGAAGSSEDITGTFNAITAILAETDATGASGYGESEYEIEITDNNGNVLFDWKPNGSGTGGATGTDLVGVNDQGCNLNTQRSANFPNLDLAYNCSADGLTFTADLPEDEQLNFLITQRNIASGISVPEPMSLALFGVGLFGLGVMFRKRRQRA